MFGLKPKIDPALIYGYSSKPQDGYAKVTGYTPSQAETSRYAKGGLTRESDYKMPLLGNFNAVDAKGTPIAIAASQLVEAQNRNLPSGYKLAPGLGLLQNLVGAHSGSNLFPGAPVERYVPIPGYVAPPKEQPKVETPVTKTTTSSTPATTTTVKAGPTAAELAAKEEARARQAAQQEAQRQAALYSSGRQSLIDETTGAVNSAFGGFDDAYFDTFAKDYAAYYTPQVGYQYDDAMKKLQLKYADAGTTNSSYQNDLGTMLTRRTEQEAKVLADAKAAADAFRGTVTGKKSALLGDLVNPEYAGPDSLPSGSDVQSQLGILKTKLSPFATKAADAAKSIARPGYTALTDLFSDLTTGPAFSSQSNNNTDFSFDPSGLYQPKAGTAARVIS